jgi:hypothetical protein
MKKSHLLTVVFVLALAFTGRADVIFAGADLNVLPSSPSGPNSTAAAHSFATAAALIGNVSTITFESAPVGSFTSLSVASGVTITGTNATGGQQSINNTFDATFPALDGYNTTPSGTNFVEMVGGTLTFAFTTPVQFFGAFLSGVQNFTQDTVTFSDGTSQTINVPETGTSGSVGELAFVGFTDAGKSITSVSINAGIPSTGFDAIGVDDVQYQSASSVPEPGSVVLLVTICVFLAAALKGRSFRGSRG